MLDVRKWLEAYGEAWRTRDPEAASALFTEDSIYRSAPFREPHRGQDGVRAYWNKATGDQRGLDLRFGVAVEWWAVMRVVNAGEGESVGTLPGCLFLIFASDGRCRELREYWHWKDEEVMPPEGWGS